MAVDSVALMISSGLNAVLGLVYWMVATRLYPVEEVGRASTLINAGIVLSSASILAFGQMLERFLPVCGRLRRRAIVGSTVVVAALATASAGAFVAFWPTGALLSEPWQAPAYVASVVALTMFALYDSVLVGLHLGRWAAAKNIVHAVVKLGLVAALGAAAFGGGAGPGPGSGAGAGPSAVAILGSWVVPAAVLVIAAQVALVVRRSRALRAVADAPVPDSAPAPERGAADPDGEPDLPPRRELVAYFATSVGWIIGQVLPGLFIPLMVERRLGLAEAAYFNIAWIVVAASIMLMSIIGGPFVAEAARPGSDLAAAARSLLRIATAASLFRLIAVGALGPVALLLYGAEYAKAGTMLLVLMGVAHFISGPAFVYGALAKVYRRIAYPMMVQLIGAVVLVWLAWAWLPEHGIVGVGWAYLVHDVGVLLAAAVPLRVMLAEALRGRR